MGKMNELSVLLEELIHCGENLTLTAKFLKDFYSGTDEAPAAPAAGTSASDRTASAAEPPKAPANEPAPAAEHQKDEIILTKEKVRALLAEKSVEEHGRYKAEVKAIVKKYGNGGSLTDVDEKDYAALVKEAKELGNG